MPVDVVHFNPPRRRPGRLSRFRSRTPLNNFGDMIGPVLVDQIRQDLGLEQPAEDRRLVAVGSIMKLTQPGDVVWGTGVNGRSMDVGAGKALDVRAVRGPKTRQLLIDAGADVPEVYGDPALLWSRYWPRESYLDRGPRREVTVIPNYNDYAAHAGDPRVVDPRRPFDEVIGAIARSEFVCGSSLHAVVFAEAFGIPARLMTSGAELPFKYEDYYAGTGRTSHRAASSIDEAIAGGGEPAPEVDLDVLLAAFPSDLYASSRLAR